ncbi:hypothetical protein TNCV_3763041 [Trichonephila clavipes]|uniref:Uncharacterized protein n=1 Tax=Trichonephila clavipes TaxID=2585209 RepID=A0A8X6VV88_TRICX|nr:hypothetical protein TNCV_3763041 [Trichonephila clavipes]
MYDIWSRFAGAPVFRTANLVGISRTTVSRVMTPKTKLAKKIQQCEVWRIRGAIEPKQKIRSSGWSVPYPTTHVQDYKNAPELQHESSSIIIHSSSFTVFSRKVWIVQVQASEDLLCTPSEESGCVESDLSGRYSGISWTFVLKCHDHRICVYGRQQPSSSCKHHKRTPSIGRYPRMDSPVFSLDFTQYSMCVTCLVDELQPPDPSDMSTRT